MYNYTDKTALLYVITRIKGLLEGYVEEEVGKGLSTNDFTNELKNKLDGIAEGATKVIVDSTLSSTGTNPVQGATIYAELAKKANLDSPVFTGTPTAPTATAGDDSTKIATTEFVTAAISTALGEITGISFEKVDVLPETGDIGVIYLVAKEGTSTDVFDEYYWYEDKFEYMGTTAVDLSGYVKATDMVPITTTEIDAMFNS